MTKQLELEMTVNAKVLNFLKMKERGKLNEFLDIPWTAVETFSDLFEKLERDFESVQRDYSDSLTLSLAKIRMEREEKKIVKSLLFISQAHD